MSVEPVAICPSRVEAMTETFQVVMLSARGTLTVEWPARSV